MEEFVKKTIENGYDEKDKFHSIGYDLVENALNGKDYKDNQSLMDYLEEIDERLVFICLFRQLVGQVNNGGFYQYFDNRYASASNDTSIDDDTPDIEAYNELMRLYSILVPKNEKTIQLYNLLKKFEEGIVHPDCEDCGGMGEVEEEYECEACHGSGYCEDEDGEEYECEECRGRGYTIERSECWGCNGKGYMNYFIFDNNSLDNEFYKLFNDEMQQFFGDLFEKWLKHWEDKIDYEVIGEDNTINENHIKKTVLKLVGTDGNAFCILAKVKEALRDKHVANDILNEFQKEAISGDYNHLLCTCMKYCEQANIEIA